MPRDELHLVGYASGIAGVDPHCGDGPFVIEKSPYLSTLTKMGIAFSWDEMIRASAAHTSSISLDELVGNDCKQLAKHISNLVRAKKFFTVIGGDHSSAIGTWSGVYDALHQQGPIGLIWIDAHMDSHTPETTISGRIHGMPFACLMGLGYSTLTMIMHYAPIKPEHVCLIGVRSFERGEVELLKRLNVRIFFMDEVKRRGMRQVWHEALDIVNQGTMGYGVSLDLDALDPQEVPGVNVSEPDGIHVNDLCQVFCTIAADARFIGAEISEFNPGKDQDHKTEKVIITFLAAMTKGKINSDANT